MFKSKFKFSTDILFQKSETDEYFEIEGLASTDDKDLEGEILKQNFDLSSILAGKGYLNDDHGNNYPNKDHARIGVIDEAKITPAGLWIKGKVWKDHPASVSFKNELKHKPGMVQFSIEGYSQKRTGANRGTVNKAYVTGVALTRNPVNPYTYAQLAKSLTGKESTASESLLIKSQHIQAIRDENDFVTSFQVTQELDPQHPDFLEYYADLIEKGGAGSGKKPTGRTQESAHSGYSKPKEEHIVAPKIDDESRDRDSNKVQRIEELKNEKESARSSAKSPEEAKRNLAEVKDRHAMSSKKKRVAVQKIEVKKSDVMSELLDRASKNPEFKKSLEDIVEKALTTGGPAYANTLPTDFTGGQIFQTEALYDDDTCEQKKKKKSTKDDKDQ